MAAPTQIPVVQRVLAVVTEVLPHSGLAYLEDAEARFWTVTRSTRGGGLDTLAPGMRVELGVTQQLRWLIACEYRALGQLDD